MILAPIMETILLRPFSYRAKLLGNMAVDFTTSILSASVVYRPARSEIQPNTFICTQFVCHQMRILVNKLSDHWRQCRDIIVFNRFCPNRAVSFYGDKNWLYPNLSINKYLVMLLYYGFSLIHNVRNFEGICAGISRSPTVRKIISVNAGRDRNPLARFLTILIIRFNPSAMAFVNLLSTNGIIRCICFLSILTKSLMGSMRLLRAVVVQRLRNLSAAQGALYSQKCSNSSFNTHAL